MELPPTSYAVLGLLSLTSGSGYDLSRFAEISLSHFWPLSRSQLYTELGRLEELGLASSTEVEQTRRPDKRIYELTPSGADALERWLSAPGHPPRRFRSGFLLKAFFAHRMDAARRLELLDAYRIEMTSDRDALATIVEGTTDDPRMAFTRATAMLGLRSAEAALAWCDEVRPLFELGVR